jgi:hypothetical protein
MWENEQSCTEKNPWLLELYLIFGSKTIWSNLDLDLRNFWSHPPSHDVNSSFRKIIIFCLFFCVLCFYLFKDNIVSYFIFLFSNY